MPVTIQLPVEIIAEKLRRYAEVESKRGVKMAISRRKELENIGFRYISTTGYNQELYACGSLRVKVDNDSGKVIQKWVEKGVMPMGKV